MYTYISFAVFFLHRHLFRFGIETHICQNTEEFGECSELDWMESNGISHDIEIDEKSIK